MVELRPLHWIVISLVLWQAIGMGYNYLNEDAEDIPTPYSLIANAASSIYASINNEASIEVTRAWIWKNGVYIGEVSPDNAEADRDAHFVVPHINYECLGWELPPPEGTVAPITSSIRIRYEVTATAPLMSNYQMLVGTQRIDYSPLLPPELQIPSIDLYRGNLSQVENIPVQGGNPVDNTYEFFVDFDGQDFLLAETDGIRGYVWHVQIFDPTTWELLDSDASVVYLRPQYWHAGVPLN